MSKNIEEEGDLISTLSEVAFFGVAGALLWTDTPEDAWETSFNVVALGAWGLGVITLLSDI